MFAIRQEPVALTTPTGSLAPLRHQERLMAKTMHAYPDPFNGGR